MSRPLLTKVLIKADAQGNAPAHIELLRVGDWHTLWHGDFEITMADLHEFAANFQKGIGLVAGDGKAPVNYAHESWDKAAGWITSLSIDEARQALVGSVEWTPAGAQALRDGEWKYISPEFNPRGCPFEDPEGTDDADQIPEFINNVLSGAALTNIPLFKKLKPVMASRLSSKPKKADAQPGSGDNTKGESMKLEDIRAKQVADLTEDEKTFLSEHKDELTKDERTTFGLAEAEADADKDADADAESDDDEDKGANADKVEASAEMAQLRAQVARLEADAKAGREAKAELELTKASSFVDTAIKAGQIKSGEKDKWVKQLLASKDRAGLEALINGLPKNETIGKELGDSGKDVSIDATKELHQKVVASIKASAEKGEDVPYTRARKEILANDADLANRVKEEEDN